MFLLPRDAKAALGSAASATPEPLEPEDPFEPFTPVTESCENPEKPSGGLSAGSERQSRSDPIKLMVSQDQNAPSLPAPRTSTLLPSASPPDAVGVARRDVASTESPKVLGGLRGAAGSCGSRPSPARRLSVIDTKWLERCQVFGEMGVDARPGAGNQEVGVKGGDEERLEPRAQNQSVETGEKDVTVAGREHAGGRARETRERNTQSPGEGEISGERAREATSPVARDKKRTNRPKRGGRKRQREEASVEGSPSEGGGVRKRRRNGKSKGGATDGTSEKAKKKDEDAPPRGTDGDAKEPETVSWLISGFKEESFFFSRHNRVNGCSFSRPRRRTCWESLRKSTLLAGCPLSLPRPGEVPVTSDCKSPSQATESPAKTFLPQNSSGGGQLCEDQLEEEVSRQGLRAAGSRPAQTGEPPVLVLPGPAGRVVPRGTLGAFKELELAVAALLLADVHAEVPAEGRTLRWRRRIHGPGPEGGVPGLTQPPGGHLLQVWSHGPLGRPLPGTR